MACVPHARMSGGEARRLALGKVVIVGEKLVFSPQSATFRARSGEPVELMVLFDYREASHEKEHVRVELTATMAGAHIGEDAHEVHDNPALADDVKGFVSVPIRVSGAGSHNGHWKLRARYARGPWSASEAAEEWILVREGDFTIEVDGARTHHV